MMFSQWVRETREGLRPAVSQEECARRYGVSQAAWAKFESQSGQPQRRTVEKIADSLGVPRSEALEAAGYSSAPADVPARLVSAWEKLRNAPIKKQNAWLDSVDSMADAVSV